MRACTSARRQARMPIRSIVPTCGRADRSLPLSREVEANEQDVGLPAVRQRAERLEPSRFLDGALRFQVEREIPGAPNELQIGDRAVAVHEERDLRLERRALRG